MTNPETAPDRLRCECGSGLPADECCEAGPAGWGRALALAGIFLVLLGIFVYQWFINPPPPLPEIGDVTHYTKVVGIDTTGLPPAVVERFLYEANRQKCPCACNLTLASCRYAVEALDHECPESLPEARKLLDKVKSAPPSPAAP